MAYTELKEKPKETKPVQPNNSVAYAEYVTTLLIAAMICGTFLITTSMWVGERQVEYLRGASP